MSQLCRLSPVSRAPKLPGLGTRRRWNNGGFRRQRGDGGSRDGGGKRQGQRRRQQRRRRRLRRVNVVPRRCRTALSPQISSRQPRLRRPFSGNRKGPLNIPQSFSSTSILELSLWTLKSRYPGSGVVGPCVANLRPRTLRTGLDWRSPPFSLPPQSPPSLVPPRRWRRGCGGDLALVSQEGGEAGPESWGGAGGQGKEQEGRGLEPKEDPDL